jgi:hypothetical protein
MRCEVTRAVSLKIRFFSDEKLCGYISVSYIRRNVSPSFQGLRCPWNAFFALQNLEDRGTNLLRNFNTQRHVTEDWHPRSGNW